MMKNLILIQQFNKGITLDVGWYLGINKFRIYVVKDSNWEEPTLRIECEDLSTLNTKVEECINFV